MARRAAICITCAAVAALLALPSAAAEAGSGIITVVSASSPASNPGSVSVELESTTPVVPTSISAELSAGGASVLTLSDFELTGGTNTGGTVPTWTVQSPITMTQLPLGSYTISVSASDTGGDTTTDPDAGTVSFLIQPTITLAASPASVSYGQNVTFSGTVTGRYPDGTSKAVADLPVDSTAGEAVTNGSGQFSFTAQAGSAQVSSGGEFDAETPATATSTLAWSNVVDITALQDPVRMAAQLSSNAVSYGSAETVTGQVSFESGIPGFR